MRARFGEIRCSSCKSFSISRSTPLKQCRLCALMRDAFSSGRAVMEMETFSSACVTLVPAFPAEWPSNFSSHFFRQKPRGLEWVWPFLAASSRRTAEPFRQKIVTVEAPVSQFVYRRPRRTTPKPTSSDCEEQAKPQKNHRKSELKFETATSPSAYVKKAWKDSWSCVPVWDKTKVS